MHKSKKKGKGFTLIELLIVIAIIGILAAIIMVSIQIARAKARDAASISERRQFSTALNIEVGEPTPNAGGTTAYFCAAKGSTETCNFWGSSWTGSNTLKAATAPTLPALKATLTPITIDGAVYDNLMYKCKTITGSGCNAALYWAQSSHTACSPGVVVYSGSGGRICGINAAGVGTDFVEVAPITPPGGGGGDDDGGMASPTVMYLPEWRVLSVAQALKSCKSQPLCI